MGLLLAIVIWAVTGMTAYYMMRGVDLMLPVVSSEGVRIDAQFMLTLAVTGIAFLLVQAALGWFVFRFRDRGDGSRATYLHGHVGVEIGGVVLTGVTFVVLGLLGQRVWATVAGEPPVPLEIRAVDHIPRSPSGKHLDFVSDFSEDEYGRPCAESGDN